MTPTLTPLSSQGGVALASIVSAYDIFKPQELNEIMQPYMDQGMSFFQELNAMRFIKPVAGDTFFTAEEMRYHDIFSLAGPVASPGAGADLVANVSAAYVVSSRAYARVGDLVFKPSTGVKGKIVNKTVSGGVVTLTIRPQKAATNLGAVVNGDVWVIYSGSAAEFTGQPEPAITKILKTEHYMQIIKETVAGSGTILTDEMWFRALEDGKNLESYFSFATLAGEYRQYLKIDGALLIGDTSDNTGDTTTKGFITAALEADGNFGALDLDTAGFAEIDSYLRTVYAPNTICAYLAQNKYREAETNLNLQFQDANIVAVRERLNNELYGGDRVLEATMQFQAVTTSGRTFLLKNLRQLDNPTVYNTGVVGNPYQDYGLFIPMTTTTDADGNRTSFMGVRHKKLGSYDRAMEVWHDGAAGTGLKIGDIDGKYLYWRSNIGAHYLKTQQWAMVTGS